MEIILIAVSLSMDAFAVSMAKGLCMPKVRYGQAAIIALFFGVFQAGMPLIGWFLGSQFEGIISPVDHWVAFALLCFIGGKMIYGAIKNDGSQEVCDTGEKLDYGNLLLMSVATSVDALAVGITLAFLNVPILLAVTLIGGITFVLSFVGVLIGHQFGIRYKTKAEIAGGAVLILIGLKILLEHLGVI